MQKTTVYLPDELKAALERTAEETGKSEAELIREGIKRVVEQRVPPAPRFGTFASGIPDLGSRVDEYLAKGFGRD
jgi:metal-responsive CopG/Arc/MetJ family transcriptional regulator